MSALLRIICTRMTRTLITARSVARQVAQGGTPVQPQLLVDNVTLLNELRATVSRCDTVQPRLQPYCP